MSRIRSIKPEFWQDFKLAAQLPRDVRLFYIGLWNEADDEGRFRAHPARLKGAIFPYDSDITPIDVERFLVKLQKCGKLVLWVHDGEPFGELRNFLVHQVINRPSKSRIPKPPNNLEEIPDLFTECSVNDPGTITDDSHQEGKGGEGKGKGKRKRNIHQSEAFESDFAGFWEVYPKKVGRMDALEKYQRQRRKGVSHAEIMAGLARYLTYKEATGEELHYPATFLGPKDWFRESWTVPEAKTFRNGSNTGTPEPRIDPKFSKPWKPIIEDRKPAGEAKPGNVQITLPHAPRGA